MFTDDVYTWQKINANVNQYNLNVLLSLDSDYRCSYILESTHSKIFLRTNQKLLMHRLNLAF